MDSLIYIFTAFVLSLVFCLRAEFSLNTRQIYIFKPLTMLVVIFAAVFPLMMGRSITESYNLWILTGLLVCLGGDILLMLGTDRTFRLGLVFFLLGHIVYTFVLIKFGARGVPEWYSIILLTASAVGIYIYLLPGLRSKKMPVLLYVIVISVMVNRSIAIHYSDFFAGSKAWLFTIGAVLFYLSDLVLAVAKFRHPFRYNRASLVLYFSGQLLIALTCYRVVCFC